MSSKANNIKEVKDIQKHIRNFSIVAHIDHGKTTLSDCIIKLCDGLRDKKFQDQFLDNLDVERQRGITVKAQTICLHYEYEGEEYILNLIDTPGHVDFHYEVSRALSACEGAVLVVDATQGVEAQTLSNATQAIDADLEMTIALNKIDLPTSDVDDSMKQIEDIIGITGDPSLVSGKTGEGVEGLVQTIIKGTPAPTGDLNGKLKALLIDGWYDPYFGVVLLIRMIDGVIRTGMEVEFKSKKAHYKVEEVGVLAPGRIKREQLQAGEIGYLIVNIKTLSDCAIGDTIQEFKVDVPALPGFKKSMPIVFCGIFPADRDDYTLLDKSLTRLGINDSSFTFDRMQSFALGMGFRCGFLGMLHMDVITQRLENEFGVTVVVTAPSVNYKVYLKDGSEILIHSPAQMPDMNEVSYIEEPTVKATIFAPHDYLGKILQLCLDRRGIQIDSQMLDKRVMMVWNLPLREIIFDFHDTLKSVTNGYASFDYELDEYVQSDIVPMSILINGTNVDSLSMMIHRQNSEQQGRQICLKLKDTLDRQQVQIAIQAALGSKIIARETLSAYRKDTNIEHKGDPTRKAKIIKNQKKGKKKMQEIAAGKVKISQKALFSVLGFSQNRKNG